MIPSRGPVGDLTVLGAALGPSELLIIFLVLVVLVLPGLVAWWVFSRARRRDARRGT